MRPGYTRDHRSQIARAKKTIRPWGGVVHTETETLDEALEVLETRRRRKSSSRKVARAARELDGTAHKPVTLPKVKFLEGDDT